MQFLKKITIAAATLLALTAFNTNAQLRLPDLHDQEHKDLIAAQRPIAADIKLVNTMKFIEQLKQEEIADNEIYSEYWESNLVNPYVGVEIPDTKNIDVSGYVHPIDIGTVTSRFGYRPRFRRMHYGIDIGVSKGTPVVSSFDGVVRLCKFERGGYGYYVVVRHDNGLETIYAHLSKITVKPNDRVKAGDQLALSGNTGRSTGPHLHFETRYLGMKINPETIIDFEQKSPINGIFAFDKKACEQSIKKAPAKITKRKTTASSRKKKTTTKKK